MRFLWKLCPQPPADLPPLQLSAGIVTAWRKTGAVDAIQALQLFPSSFLAPASLRGSGLPILVRGQDRVPPHPKPSRGSR